MRISAQFGALVLAITFVTAAQASIENPARRYQDALASLDRSIGSAPHELGAYQLKATLLLQLSRQIEAAGVAEAVIMANPNAPEAYTIASGIYARLDLREKAIDVINRSISLAPGGQLGAEMLVRRAAMREPDDFVRREEDITTALKLEPTNLSALFGKAALEYDRGDFASAAQSYIQIREVDGNKPGTLNLLGFALYRSGHTAEADQIFEQARTLARNSQTLSALCWGKVSFNVALDRALEECQAALKLDPDEPHVLDSRGMIYLRMGRFKEARSDFDRALRQFPQQANSLFARAVLRARTGDWDGARKDAQAALRLWPHAAETFQRWGIEVPERIIS